MGRRFAHETGELGFRLRCDFGIVHGAATSLAFCFASRYSAENGGRLPRFLHPPPEPNQKMGKLQVPQELTFWGKVGNFFVKTLKFLKTFGKLDTKEEQERLRVKLNEFCDGILAQVERQRDAIEGKVREVMR